MATAADVLHALACGRPSCPCVKSERLGHGLSHCPAHRDEHPSLSVRPRNGDDFVATCHTGCTHDAIWEALKEKGVIGKVLQIPKRKLERKGAAISYAARTADGTVLAYHVRIMYNNGTKGFEWRQPNGSSGLNGLPLADVPLYGTELLVDHPKRSAVIVEGEKAAEALRPLYPLTLGTMTGAGGAPGSEVLACLRGRKVALWPDNDEAGTKHMERIGERLVQLQIPVVMVNWPEAPPKGDAADYVAGNRTVDDLLSLLRAAPQWLPKPSDRPSDVTLRVTKTNPRTFYLALPGVPDIVLGTDDLVAWGRVKKQCLEQHVRMPEWRPRSAEHWGEILTELLKDPVIVEAPPELTTRGRLLDLTERYFEGAGDRREVLGRRGVWFDDSDRSYVFRLGDLIKFIERQGEKDVSRGAILELIKETLRARSVRQHLESGYVRTFVVAELVLNEALDRSERSNGDPE